MSKYSNLVRWSDEDNCYIAIAPEFSAVSAFGDTPEEAVRELQVALSLVLKCLADEGRPAPEPNIIQDFSGQLRVRMPKSLHAELANRALIEGVSLNSLIVYLLSQRADKKVKTTKGTMRKAEPIRHKTAAKKIKVR